MLDNVGELNEMDISQQSYRERDNLSPQDRVERLAEVSPLRQRAYRPVFFIGVGIALALATIIIVSVIVSEQAAALMNVWLERISMER